MLTPSFSFKLFDRVEELSLQVDQMSARCQEMEEVLLMAFLVSHLFSQTEIILKDELEEMRKKESTMLYMREKDRKVSSLN